MADVIIFIGEQWIAVSLLMLFVFSYFLLERSRSGLSIGYNQLTAMVNKANAVVLDVRSAKEFEDGHIADAINISHDKIENRIAELEKHRGVPIIIVDKIGQHASSVGKALTQDGYTAFRLSGGISEWTANKLPLVK